MIITTPQIKCDLCARMAVMTEKQTAPAGWVEVAVQDLRNRQRPLIVVHLCPDHTKHILRFLNAELPEPPDDVRPPDAR